MKLKALINAFPPLKAYIDGYWAEGRKADSSTAEGRAMIALREVLGSEQAVVPKTVAKKAPSGDPIGELLEQPWR